jgi:hypothetical protein
MHKKVANQSYSELSSSSPTRSSGPPHIQSDGQNAYDLYLDVLHMHRKIRRQPFQCHQSHVQLKSESSAIIKILLISRIVFGAAPLFWPDGPCI